MNFFGIQSIPFSVSPLPLRVAVVDVYRLEVRLVTLDAASFPSTEPFEYYRSYVFRYFVSAVKRARAHDYASQTLGIKRKQLDDAIRWEQRPEYM